MITKVFKRVYGILEEREYNKFTPAGKKRIMALQTTRCKIDTEGSLRILRCDYNRATLPPSIEDSEEVMAEIITQLAEKGAVSKIVLEQLRDYEYDIDAAESLYEIAEIYKLFIRDRPRPEDIADDRSPTFRDEMSRRLAALYSLIYIPRTEGSSIQDSSRSYNQEKAWLSK